MTNGTPPLALDLRPIIYDVLTRKADTASTLADYRFYYYLVANTLLVLAWVELYGMSSCPSASDTDKLYRLMACVLAFFIPAFGAWLAWAFRGFLKRTKLYERHYLAWAAQMEVDPTYYPTPFLWTGLIREHAEEINNLDSSPWSVWQQLLRVLWSWGFGKAWVRAEHIFPSRIKYDATNRMFTATDSPIEAYTKRVYSNYYARRKRPSGTAFNIYSKVKLAFMLIFLLMAVFSGVTFAKLWLLSVSL